MTHKKSWHAWGGGTALALILGPALLSWGVERGSELAVRQAMRGTADVTVGTVAVRPRGLHLGGLRWQTGAVRATAEALDLPLHVPAFAWAQPAYGDTGTSSADGVRIETPTATISIPHLEARGTALSGQDLAGIFARGDTPPLEDRLAKATAASITAPDILISPKTAGAEAQNKQITLHNVVLTDVNAGKVGSLTVESVTATTIDGDVRHDAMTGGSITIQGLDVPLIVAMNKGPRTDPDMPLRTIYDRLTVGPLKFLDGQKQVGGIAGIDIAGVKGRPFATAMSRVKTVLDVPESDRTDEERKVVADLAADALTSVSLDHFEVRGIAIPSNGEPNGATVTLGRLSMDGYGGGGIKSMAAETIGIESEGTHLTAGRFAIEGFGGEGFKTLIQSEAKSPEQPVPPTSLAQLTNGQITISLVDAHVVAPAKDGDGNSADGRQFIVDMPSNTLTLHHNAEDKASDLSALMRVTFDVAPSASAPQMQQLTQAGFSRLDVAFDYGMNWIEKPDSPASGHLAVTLKDLAALSAKAKLGSVSPDLFGQDAEAKQAALEKLRVEGLDLSLVNFGLIEKILPIGATQANLTVPAFRAGLIAQARAGIDESLGGTPLAEKMKAAVTEFLENPKSLHLAVSAPKGVTMDDIAKPETPNALLDQLDITVTANH